MRVIEGNWEHPSVMLVGGFLERYPLKELSARDCLYIVLACALYSIKHNIVMIGYTEEDTAVSYLAHEINHWGHLYFVDKELAIRVPKDAESLMEEAADWGLEVVG